MYMYSEKRKKDNREREDVNKAIKSPLADGNKRRDPMFVAYEHVTKHVTNVKNDMNGRLFSNRGISWPPYIMMASFLSCGFVILK